MKVSELLMKFAQLLKFKMWKKARARRISIQVFNVKCLKIWELVYYSVYKTVIFNLNDFKMKYRVL